MKLGAVWLSGVLAHDDTRFELPDSGVVTVEGPNGAGKSALFVEAPAVAVWGKTLRGTPPWEDETKGVAGAAVVCSDGSVMSIERSKTPKGRPKLKVSGGPGAKRLRAKDETEDLVRELGGMERWRRTHVFSASDADSFMKATDGDCKRFLEKLFGLECFDVGLAACRKDLRAAEEELRKLEADLRVAGERVAAEARRLREAERDLAELGEPEPVGEDPTARLREAEREVEVVAEHVEQLQAQLVEKRDERREVDAELRRAERDAERLARDACPECGQRIPKKKRREAEDGLKVARGAHEGRAKLLGEQVFELDVLLGDRRAELPTLRGKVAELERALARHEGARQMAATRAERRKKLETRVRDATSVLVSREDEQDELEAGAAERRRQVGTLRAAERVLGLRGVRNAVLGLSLGGLEEAGNAWLDRLMPGASLRLEPISETKKGDAVEAIARHIDGLRHRHGYKACSSGQRRRVDLAMLFALAEVESGSGGVGLEGAGTMLFDEALDALDDEGGLDAAIEVVHELAEDRCVVVVSHRADLLKRLRAACRLRVEDGRLAA